MFYFYTLWNRQKPVVFWRFQEVQKRNTGVKCRLMLPFISVVQAVLLQLLQKLQSILNKRENWPETIYKMFEIYEIYEFVTLEINYNFY